MYFSDDLKMFGGELPPSILAAIKNIKAYFDLPDVKVLSYDENSVVVPVTFKVSIPPKGTVGGVEIFEEEPVLIKFLLEFYPYVIPSIMSDRKNFPKNQLPHLYSTDEGEPAKLCLVRNSPSEWFANKTIKDFLLVGEQWFFKAVTGTLVDDGDEFDPIRLESYGGFNIYKYNTLEEIVRLDRRFINEQPMAICLGCVYKDDLAIDDSLTYKTISAIPFIGLPAALAVTKEYYSKGAPRGIAHPNYSMLLWSPEGTVNGSYDTQLPKNWGELKELFAQDGIDLKKALKIYLDSKLDFRTHLPIIYAILRPKKMVGYSGEYEFINFSVSLSGLKSGVIPDDAKVACLSHIEPFSKDLARKLTNENRDAQTLFIGAGSLGSKIIIHDARSGKLSIGAVDADKILQHNIVRHALYQNRIGQNKAEAIIAEISDFYHLDTTKNFKAYPYDLILVDKAEFEKYNWLVDTTASFEVQNYLTVLTVPDSLKISRCELADDGTLGLLYIEGENRNPRLDDLVNLAYYKGISDFDLQQWRLADAKREVTSVDVGLGCSSTTTVVSDDVISFHASVFSKLLANESNSTDTEKNGLLYTCKFDTSGLPEIRNTHYNVDPFEIYECNAGSGWQIRMLAGLTNGLLKQCAKKGKRETGGVLVGVANYKTRVIHVFDFITETQDSKGTPTTFLRGIKGLPEAIEDTKELTGGIVGYIGEWHTHPMDLEHLSGTDKDTIEELVAINNAIPIPTLALIVTTSKLLPFVFE
ncbi:MAG: ThiF family adenylyltransferase [Bacteroidota bacterium]|nr:ThiF family adenylyltransferase [Bacteroidota bacterium]